MRSAGFSATSGSRLFSSIRRAASCCHPRQRREVPRAARTTRGAAAVGTDLSIHSVEFFDDSRHRGAYEELPGPLEIRRELAVAVPGPYHAAEGPPDGLEGRRRPE